MPGQLLVLDADGAEARSEFFWSIRAPANGDAASEERPMRQALWEVVRQNLQPDWRDVGICLSGGIDSASVANLAQRQSDGPVKTFCLATEEVTLNEGDAARDIARAIGSEHHEVMMTEQRF